MGFGLVGIDTDPSTSTLLNVIPLSAILLATWIARRVLDRRSFRSLGFRFNRHTWADLAFGFALPGLLFGLIFAFEWAMGWISFQGWAWDTISPGQSLHALLTMLGLFIIVGIQEELLSRGYHLQNMAEAMSLQWAIFISSAIFSVLHAQNPFFNIASLLGLLAAGYMLAFAWGRTRNLWLPIGLHIGWNFFEGTIFGFPVSGLQGFSLINQTVEGPEWATGGAFGPEAGLLVFPVIILAGFIIWLYTLNRVIRPASLVDPVR
jgi:membrane protease YdiL (CAAX protease family)